MEAERFSEMLLTPVIGQSCSPQNVSLYPSYVTCLFSSFT